MDTGHKYLYPLSPPPSPLSTKTTRRYWIYLPILDSAYYH